ncbi:isopentenyl transferase family protein, partial [Bdellovibrionota bacterium]
MFFGEVVIGPTASGKTEYAVSKAREIGATILSVDSLIVYRQLNIGAAKPSQEILSEIPHKCVNIVDLDQPFTAIDFREEALNAIHEAEKLKSPLIIVGGSFFYLRALFSSPSGAPQSDPVIHAELNSRADKD